MLTSCADCKNGSRYLLNMNYTFFFFYRYCLLSIIIHSETTFIMPENAIPIITHTLPEDLKDSKNVRLEKGNFNAPAPTNPRTLIPPGRSAHVTFPLINSPQRASSSRLPNREKVILKPHHSALDWERIKKTSNVKRISPDQFPMKITKEELRNHKSQCDCWIALGGKVYNITDYLEFHPGGVTILLKYAGLDATQMFMKYHRWVNFERILDECFIGFLIKK